MATAIYYFDAHLEYYDKDEWTNPENAFNGNTTDYAEHDSYYPLYLTGTNAPLTGGEVYGVRFRVLYELSQSEAFAAFGFGLLEGEEPVVLGIDTLTPTSGKTWSSWLSGDFDEAPSWSDLARLEAVFGNNQEVDPLGTLRIYRAEIEVESDTINQPPSVTLNTPDNATLTATPQLQFTGIDLDSDDLTYQIQIDTSNTFDSGGGS